MPIKGVTEVIRLPRLGKIRLGVKIENAEGTIYPSPTEYFVCPEEVRKVLGERPRELRIMFPTDDETQWASQYLRCYSATRGLICRGDGLTAVARADVHTGEIAGEESEITELCEITCDPAKCVLYQQGQCRRVMNLQFLLPDCPGFGVYQIDTSSYHSIVDINSMLKIIRGTCQRLSMIPLSLRLVLKAVHPAGEWKEIYILNLRTPYSLIEMQAYARIPPGRVLLVPPPDSEAPDDLFPNQTRHPQDPLVASSPNDHLLRIWNKAISMIRGLDICESQIAYWFQRHYRLKVGLSDFDGEFPPAKLTIEKLQSFCEAVERQRPYS